MSAERKLRCHFFSFLRPIFLLTLPFDFVQDKGTGSVNRPVPLTTPRSARRTKALRTFENGFLTAVSGAPFRRFPQSEVHPMPYKYRWRRAFEGGRSAVGRGFGSFQRREKNAHIEQKIALQSAHILRRCKQ